MTQSHPWVHLDLKTCLEQRNTLMDEIISHIEANVPNEEDALRLIEPISDLVAEYFPCCDPKSST